MSADEQRDADCEYEMDSPIEFTSTDVTKKSLSTVGFRDKAGGGFGRPVPLRATQSHTGALDRLRICPEPQITLAKAEAAPTCPCGCLARPATLAPFRTREQHSLALHVVPPDILHHQGRRYDAERIALYWKKDCRKFLWKGQARDYQAEI